MALVIGNNCGFVSTAPTANPGGTAFSVSNTILAFKDVASTDSTITEVGMWIDAAADPKTFLFGIYQHNGTFNKPTNLYYDQITATASAGAWLRLTLSTPIPISAGSTYWIMAHNESTNTNGDKATISGRRYVYNSSASSINPAAWAFTDQTAVDNVAIAIYALVGPGVPGGNQVESEYLVADNFGFSGMPSNAQITDVKVRFNVDTIPSTVNVRFSNVRLWNNAFVGTNVYCTEQTGQITSTGDKYYEGTIEASYWNYALTKAIVENANFGVGFAIIFSNNTPTDEILKVSEIEITVYYVSDTTSDFDVDSNTLLGDRTTGIIYQPTRGEFRDYNTSTTFHNIKTIRRTGQITHNTLKNKSADKLSMRVKRGVGNADETAPTFILRWRDNYESWSLDKHIGLGGETDTYTIAPFFRLGTYKTRQYEIVHDDPTDFIFCEGDEEVDLLEH